MSAIAAYLWVILGVFCLINGLNKLPDAPPKRDTYLVSYAFEGGNGHTVLFVVRPMNDRRIKELTQYLKEQNPDKGNVVITGLTKLDQ